MLHIELVLVTQMIVNASLTKHWIDAIVLSQENVAELFFALLRFDFLRENFLSVLVDETNVKINDCHRLIFATAGRHIYAASLTF